MIDQKTQAEQDAAVAEKFRTALKNAEAVRFAPEEVRDQAGAEVDAIATHPDIAFHLMRRIDRLAGEISWLERENKRLRMVVARGGEEVRMKGATPSAGRKAIETRIKVLQTISEGLAGKPFYWGSTGQSKPYMRMAREMGVQLVTIRQIADAGHTLNPRAKPVGSCSFGSQYKRDAALFVLGVQTKAKEQ